MLSQSAASLSAELVQTKAALARLQAEHQSEQITVATLRSNNTGMEQRLADRVVEVKALAEQLAHARVQFEHFQEAIAAQRLEDRRAFDRHAGRLEHDLASAQQQLDLLRAEHAARADEARAAQEELATVLADRVQLTRQLAEAATSAEILVGKLEKTGQEVIEARMALAAQQGQAELLARQFAGATAERDKLVQENAALRERAQPGAAHARNARKSGG